MQLGENRDLGRDSAVQLIEAELPTKRQQIDLKVCVGIIHWNYNAEMFWSALSKKEVGHTAGLTRPKLKSLLVWCL